MKIILAFKRCELNCDLNKLNNSLSNILLPNESFNRVTTPQKPQISNLKCPLKFAQILQISSKFEEITLTDLKKC